MSTAKQTEAMQRDGRALALRRAGASFPSIAEAVGYRSPSSARSAVSRALERDGSGTSTNDELRDLEVQRLDQMQVALWKKALSGDIKASQQLLAIQQQRARLLGLTPPIQTDADPVKAGKEPLTETQARAVLSVLYTLLTELGFTGDQLKDASRIAMREVQGLSTGKR